MAVILRNNKPRYIVVDFDEYEDIKNAREKLIENTTDMILAENMEAFQELAK